MVIYQTVWSYFRNLSWSNVLAMVTIGGGIAAVVVPYLDASWFRSVLVVFIAVSLYVQNLSSKQEIQRTRTMIRTLHDQTLP